MTADVVRRRVLALERALDRQDRPQVSTNSDRLLDVVVDLDAEGDDELFVRCVVDLGVTASAWAAGLGDELDVDNARRALGLARKARMMDGRPVPY